MIKSLTDRKLDIALKSIKEYKASLVSDVLKLSAIEALTSHDTIEISFNDLDLGDDINLLYNEA